MKTVQICVSCFSTVIDGESRTDHDSVTKLILVSNHNPNDVYIHRWVCPNCKIFLDENYCKQLLEKKEFSLS